MPLLRPLYAPALRAGPVLVCFCILGLFAATLSAQPTTTNAPDAPVVNQQAAPLPPHAIDTGSTAWMLTSSALVLFMVPGLALFYGGMVRAKNVLNMFLCVMVAIGVIGLHWVIIGYCMAFAGTSLITVGSGNPPWSLLGWDKRLLFL